MCKLNPNCACCDVPEPEPCSTYELGRNGRCVYCDHEGECHKKWGDIFNKVYRRTGDSAYAANCAELWHMAHRPSKRRSTE